MLHKVVLTFESVDEILSVTIQMKAIELLSIMLYEVALTSAFVNEILYVTIQKKAIEQCGFPNNFTVLQNSFDAAFTWELF